MGSSTFYVYSDVTFSPAHVISWLYWSPPSTYSNILNAECGICTSRITELFPDQYGPLHLPQVLADGNSRYLLPKGYYWQMCHTHYPFDPPVWLLSGNVRTFPIGRIQDNRISSRLSAALVSSIVLANSACFTSVKELLYVRTCGQDVVSCPDPMHVRAIGSGYRGLQVICQRTELENLKMTNQNWGDVICDGCDASMLMVYSRDLTLNFTSVSWTCWQQAYGLKIGSMSCTHE